MLCFRQEDCYKVRDYPGLLCEFQTKQGYTVSRYFKRQIKQCMVYLFSVIYIYIIFIVYLFTYVSICVYHLYAVLTEAERGCWIPGNRS